VTSGPQQHWSAARRARWSWSWLWAGEYLGTRGALLLVLGNEAAERVNVVDVSLIDVGNGCFDVARDGKVDEKQ